VLWTEIGMLCTTVVLVLITVSATVINYFFFRSQTDPEVIVYTSPDERRPSVVILVIENIGRSLAKNITFACSKPIPQKAFRLGDDAPTPKTMDHGPIINGIPSLGPHSKRIITWGQYGGLKKGIGDEVIDITVTFRSDRMLGLGQRYHKVVCPIDIKSFAGTDAADYNWDKKAVDQLKKTAKTMEHIASDFRSLKAHLIQDKESIE
jgi:hypothetical protein